MPQMSLLNCVQQTDQKADHRISYQLHWDQDQNLQFSFQVEKDFSGWNYAKKLNDQNWGLWSGDVVELFITTSEHKAPYLELQISADKKLFFLLIHSPRQSYSYIAPIDQFDSMIKDFSISDNLWKATIEIGDHYFCGDNFFFLTTACLFNHQGKQLYYSSHPMDDILDFHRPQFFAPLSRKA